MATEIRVPTLGESVTEATIGRWFKQPGEAVKADEPLVELETDKVTLEVNAPAAGVLGEQLAKEGETVAVNAVLGSITDGAAATSRKRPPPWKSRRLASRARLGPRQARSSSRTCGGLCQCEWPRRRAPRGRERRRPLGVAGTGKDGRVTKGDMLHAIAGGAGAASPPAATSASTAPAPLQLRAPSPPDDASREERVRMTKLRQTIARAPEGGAEHRRHADDLQRGRHVRGDGAARPVQGRLREAARRQARLHGVLRQGLRRRR